MSKFYIGYDIGSSSIKVALVDSANGKNIAVVSQPSTEMDIISLHDGWAEQDPDLWWEHVCMATNAIISKSKISPSEIIGIGIAYQMHGLVLVNVQGDSLRNSIIWCDSRAVEIGNKAFEEIGHERCMSQLLNSPGNFTASKLKWVKENEPDIYKQAHKFMLPGDYIAYKLSGKIATTRNGLSEGILWDHQVDGVANWLLDHFGIAHTLTPEIVGNFTNQGEVTNESSILTGLPSGIPIIYRAGDQPNNALSLNILKPGEVAATGGTSGVLYAVTDQIESKEHLRINSFAHVNYSQDDQRLGKLLCINSAGIQYRWLMNLTSEASYEEMNRKAQSVPIGSEGILVLPFGNGAERMLNNKNLGTHISNLNLNVHGQAHLYRATLEGIAFSFVYGMEILKNDKAIINVIRTGNDNLFRSEIFSTTISTLIGHDIEIYNTTGAIGAARAVGLSDGDFTKFGRMVTDNDYEMTFKPLVDREPYERAYQRWKKELQLLLKNK